TSLTGTYDRSATRGGATAGAIAYALTQAGNYLDGHLSQSPSGSTRYALLQRFIETSNQATGTPGNVAFLPYVGPLLVGAGPTGGGVSATRTAALDALFAHYGAGAGSLADAMPRDLQAAAPAALGGGYALSGASALESSAGQGNQLVQEYCFAAGTLVLLAD